MPADTLSPGKAAMTHVGLLLLRVIVGACLIAQHAWAMAVTGWHHFWGGDDWVLARAADALGLPQPVAWAVAFAVVAFVGALLLIAGLLGRITPAVLLGACLAALYASASRDIHDYTEAGILYAAVFVCLAATGPGALCLDRLFVRRPRRLQAGLQDIV